jgi:hypothetical protein
MHKPQYAQTLADTEFYPQVRLGIQGAPGVGKSWAALTFPNPLVINSDRGLMAHQGRAEITEIAIWNPEKVAKILGKSLGTAPPNRRDAILKILREDGPKFTAEQTLIHDAWTGFQHAFDAQTNLEPVYTKSGNEDKLAFWARKLEFSKDVCEFNKTLKCSVVLLCHETVERNEDGLLTGKVKPLQQGQFADQLASYFTDWFRQIAVSKEPKDLKKLMADLGCKTEDEYKSICNQFPDSPTLYLWQTRSNDVCNCKTALVGAPVLIPANYASYVKYIKKGQSK